MPKTVLTRDIQWIFDGVGSRGTENMKGDRKTQLRWPEEWRIVVFISTTIFGLLLFPYTLVFRELIHFLGYSYHIYADELQNHTFKHY